jgi:dolichol-phosphate mannosyltransferase
MTSSPSSGTTHDSISVIIPARDEALRLAHAVTDVLEAVREQFERYELLVVNDGSTDATGEIADRLAGEHPGVHVIHLPRVHGLGGAFKEGLRRAVMDYVTVAHGDGGTPASELTKIWSLRQQADLIVPYMINDHERPAARLFVSRCFRFLVNALFGIRLRCHGHYVLYRRAVIQSIRLRTDGHAFQAEALVKLLRLGHSFVEVGVCDDFEGQAPTRSYQLANVLRIAAFFVWTLYDVYVAPGGLGTGRGTHVAVRQQEQ